MWPNFKLTGLKNSFSLIQLTIYLIDFSSPYLNFFSSMFNRYKSSDALLPYENIMGDKLFPYWRAFEGFKILGVMGKLSLATSNPCWRLSSEFQELRVKLK